MVVQKPIISSAIRSFNYLFNFGMLEQLLSRASEKALL